MNMAHADALVVGENLSSKLFWSHRLIEELHDQTPVPTGLDERVEKEILGWVRAHSVSMAMVETHQAAKGGWLVEASLPDLRGDADNDPACRHAGEGALNGLARQACAFTKLPRAPRMIQFAQHQPPGRLAFGHL